MAVPPRHNYYDGVPGVEGIDTTDPLATLRAIAAPPPSPMMPGAVGVRAQLPPPVSGPPKSDRWQALLGMVGPIASMFADKNPAGRAAFQQGWQAMETRDQEDRARKQQASSRFTMEAGQHLLTVTDPGQFEQTKRLFTEAGEKGGLDTSGIQAIEFNIGAFDTKKRALMTAELDKLEQGGYNLDELAQSDARIRLADGSDIPVRLAMQARSQVIDKSGKTVAKPAKLAATEEERYAADPSADKLARIAEFRQAGRADPSTPKPSELERLSALLGKIRAAKSKGDTATAATLQAEYDDAKQAKKDMGQADDRPPNAPRDRFVVQPVTNPDGTTSIVRVDLDTGRSTPIMLPRGTSGAGRPNESERNSSQFLERVVPSDRTATDFESKLVGLGAQFDVQLPNLLRSPEGQRYRQAQDEFINAGLRDESGAAIQIPEYGRYRGIYFAMPGDTAATIKQKQEARQRIIVGLRRAAGNLGKGESVAPTKPGRTFKVGGFTVTEKP